ELCPVVLFAPEGPTRRPSGLDAQETPPTPRDVLDRGHAGTPADQALPAGEIPRVNGAVVPDFDRREPDLAPARRPGEPLGRFVDWREPRNLSGAVDDGDRAGVIPGERMVDECDPLSVAGKARVTDPAVRLVEDRVDGGLGPIARARLPDDRQVPPGRGPA